MATLTTEKPVETQEVFSDGSSAPPQLLEAEPTTQVERRDAPAVSTIKEPAVITFQVLSSKEKSEIDAYLTGYFYW